jgi:predicted  nucleic acid-binding Zn-ribbon protein
VQELDSRIDQLRHQLNSLPETAEIAALSATGRELVDQARDAQIAVDDLTLEQKRADADVEQVKARRERDRSRMDQGLISNPKDLERMQHELVSLERRITTLEDAEIEVMEQLEQAQTTLDSLTTQIASAKERIAALSDARDLKAGDINVELLEATHDRGVAAEEMPEDLMALYEKIRSTQGIGAAALRARQCLGCNMTLNPADLAVIAKAPVDEVVRCEECSRILVRTTESGL